MSEDRKINDKVWQAIRIETGRFLKRKRLKHKLNQATLGAFVGISHQQICKYESGRSELSFVMLIKFLELLDVNLVELLNVLSTKIPLIENRFNPRRRVLKEYMHVPDATLRELFILLMRHSEKARKEDI